MPFNFYPMLNWFKRIRPAEPATPDLPGKTKVNTTELPLFERAIQLYIFVHHLPHHNLPAELREQLRHTGNAVYSLLLNWLRDDKPSLEYMDFLNEKLNELRQLSPELLMLLPIKPNEIHLLELQDTVWLRFQDEENEITYHLKFVKAESCCYHNVAPA